MICSARTHITLVSILLVGSAACGKDKEEAAAERACGVAPASALHKPALPAKFPTPQGVTYTTTQKQGPTRVVSGYLNGGVGDAYDAYKSAFPDAGYDVTKSEHEEVDAEVNFSGGGATGQVKLLQTCRDRTTITITIRPA